MDGSDGHREPMPDTFLMDASLAPLKRRFESHNDALHERLPFSTPKIAHSLSTAFEGSRYDRKDQQKVLVEFEPNGKASDTEAGDRLNQCDECQRPDESSDREGVVVHLILCGVSGQNVGLHDLRNMQGVLFVSIHDGIAELCESCFSKCVSLYHVTFGESSSFKWISKKAFYYSGVCEIHIPDAVEELCESCFSECVSLSRVTFGERSSLKLIGKEAFSASGVREIHIPDGVKELCERCFARCKRLSRVTFGNRSSLRLIGIEAFSGSGVCEIHIPDSVSELYDLCFSQCKSLLRVKFGEQSALAWIGAGAFQGSGLSYFSLLASVGSIGGASFSNCPLQKFVVFDDAKFTVDGCLLFNRDNGVIPDKCVCYGCIGHVEEVVIPDSVEELSESCFARCKSLFRVELSESSSLKRVGKEAFSGSGVCEIHIPDSVKELSELCFARCKSLFRVEFSESSLLKRIGKGAFSGSGVCEIHIPDSVKELSELCFFECRSLSCVTFGESSLLKRVGKEAFSGSGVTEIHIPGRIEEILRHAIPVQCRVIELASCSGREPESRSVTDET